MSGITAWLDGLGLGNYATIFVENAIDLDVLPDLNETDLERLGVALGHRKRILRAIAALSRNASPRTSADVASPDSETQRRHLTVLFCDIVGSTELAVQLDPEDLNGVIRRFQATCNIIITHNGGYVARLMGDGILAYFGYPQAQEDDAESAVRTGLDLVAKVSQLLLPSNEPLKLRVGIATGLVIVRPTISERSAQEQAVFGETPNLAARLQSLAPPNSVVIAKSTRDLLGEVFVCEQLGSYEIKGISEPVTVCRITGERAVESRFDARRRSAKLTQFVGRQHELQQLLESWAQAKEGDGQVVLLCGEPGIGKSRIAVALFDLITEDPHITMRIQCSLHHTRSPFYPVIRQLSRVAGFEREDGPEVKLEKLETMLSSAGQASLANAALFAALLSIPSAGRYPAVELTPQRRKDLTIASFIRYLQDLAGTRPILFVCEDVHWIDPTTIELLNRTINSIKTVPLLFVITFRPEFFPPWLDQPHVKMLRLERLGRRQVEAMIADITGGKKLPAEVFEQIVNKTDGVPLFVEELTKAVLESGLLKDAGDRYVNEDSLPVRAVPTTLHDSLMARLDRLAQIKEIAQIGAALGREFSYRLLAAVAPISDVSLKAALAQFGIADLIFCRGEAPDSTYFFKHALVQDAAYSTLTRSKCKQLHSKIASALKDQFSETVETQPELMAHHLELAGLTEQAIDYLRLAGQRAIERSANAEAIGHLKHALKLLESLPAGGQRTRVAFGLEALLAQALIAARGYAAAETKETLLRARALLDDSTEPSQKFAVLYGLWACYYVGGECNMLQRAAAELLVEAERHGGTASLCLSHRLLGTTYISLAQFDAARQHLERARALYDPQHHPPFRYLYGQDMGATVLCYLSWALWHLGYVDQALRTAADAVKHAEALAHPFTMAYTIGHARGMMDVFRRRPDDTRSYAALIVSICNEHGFPFWAASGRVLEGWAATCQGDTDKGLEQLRAGVAAWQETGARLWLPIYLALEAEGHSKAGDSGAAFQAIEQAIATSKETGEQWAIAEVLRMKARLLVEARRASDGEIETLLMESIEIARRQQARCWELRATCDLARLWQRQGRDIEAFNLLRSIYDQFTEGFDTPDLLDAKAIMDAINPRSIAKRNGAPKKAATRKPNAGASRRRHRST
jgi:predicted ATPase/class 3 adenylate cyclase